MVQEEMILKLFNDLIKGYEKSECYGILFYSKDFSRDFKLLELKVKEYKERLNKLLKVNAITSAGIISGEKDLQKELI